MKRLRVLFASFMFANSYSATTIAAENDAANDAVPQHVTDFQNSQFLTIKAGVNSGPAIVVNASCQVVAPLSSVVLDHDIFKPKLQRRGEIEVLFSIGVATRQEREQLLNEIAELNKVLGLYSAQGIPQKIEAVYPSGDSYKATLIGVENDAQLAYLQMERQQCAVLKDAQTKGLGEGSELFSVSADTFSPTMVSGNPIKQGKSRYIPLEQNSNKSLAAVLTKEGDFLGVTARLSIKDELQLVGLGGRALKQHIENAAEINVNYFEKLAGSNDEEKVWSKSVVDQKLSSCVDFYIRSQWLKAYQACNDIAEYSVQAQFIKAEITINGSYHHGKDAVALYEAAASEGYGDANYRLGKLYLDGNIVNRDFDQGYRLMELACEQGSASACEYLANRKIMVHRYADAVPLLKKSETHGGIGALIDLGDMYRNGRSFSKDSNKAVQYYRKAAQLGSNEAQYVYAQCVYEGMLGKIDYFEAYTWLLVAEIDHLGVEDEHTDENWSKAKAASLRFEIGRLLNTSQKERAATKAKTIVSDIRETLHSHRRQQLLKPV